VLAMLRQFKSTALKISIGGGLVILSFLVSLQAMQYFRSPWESIRSNTILTFGDASSSTIFLTEGAKFQFPGNGYVEIQNTKSLQCLRVECRFLLAVVFGPASPSTRLIVGQSFSGEDGWHLKSADGRLVLQTEGGGSELAAAFDPKPGQRYRIDIVRSEEEVRLSVDDVVLAKSKAIPFTNVARDLTFGGRGGSNQMPFVGTISEVQISWQWPQR
jgi:hypothetical protein